MKKMSKKSEKNMFWFQLHHRDFLADVQPMTNELCGAYIKLLCHYVNRQQSLPDDDQLMARLVGVSVYKWRKLKPELQQMFTVKDGEWHQEELDSKIAHSMDVREKRRASGKLGGQKSWEKRQANAEANASNESKQMLNKLKLKLNKPPVRIEGEGDEQRKSSEIPDKKIQTLAEYAGVHDDKH